MMPVCFPNSDSEDDEFYNQLALHACFWGQRQHPPPGLVNIFKVGVSRGCGEMADKMGTRTFSSSEKMKKTWL